MAQNTTRLRELLGVNENEEFGYGSYIFRVNNAGTFQMKRDDGAWESPNAAWLCSAIADKESIHRRQWTDGDVEDAKAVKRLWPQATIVRRWSDCLVVGHPNTMYQWAITTKAFPSVEEGKDVKLDDVLGIEVRENECV